MLLVTSSSRSLMHIKNKKALVNHYSIQFIILIPIPWNFNLDVILCLMIMVIQVDYNGTPIITTGVHPSV